jgi:hypothetical protein
MHIHLEDHEINAICDGLTQPAAMVAYLRRQGFEVRKKPNGRPLVSRANFEAVMRGNATPAAPSSPGPNTAAILQMFGKRAGAV